MQLVSMMSQLTLSPILSAHDHLGTRRMALSRVAPSVSKSEHAGPMARACHSRHSRRDYTLWGWPGRYTQSSVDRSRAAAASVRIIFGTKRPLVWAAPKLNGRQSSGARGRATASGQATKAAGNDRMVKVFGCRPSQVWRQGMGPAYGNRPCTNPRGCGGGLWGFEVLLC